MAKRSVHISEKTESVIGFMSDEKTNGSKNYSGSINSGLLMLEQLMIQSKPELSQDEWVYLANVYSGCLIELGTTPIRIASDIMDDLGIYDISAIDDIGRGLIQKISPMSQCQQAAILWEIKRMWQAV